MNNAEIFQTGGHNVYNWFIIQETPTFLCWTTLWMSENKINGNSDWLKLIPELAVSSHRANTHMKAYTVIVKARQGRLYAVYM